MLRGQACYEGIDNGSRASCCWQWKRDTSSDEVDGHIAAFAVAHAVLAVTPEEKARLARPLCATVQYIVDGGLVFIDPVTENRTTWGYWDPTNLNGVSQSCLCLSKSLCQPPSQTHH